MKLAHCVSFLVATGLVAACGSDTTTGFTNPDASVGGTSGNNGGASGSGNNGGTSPGGASVGGSGAGGTSGGGAGGAIPEGDGGPCAAPLDASKSAVCVKLVPESIVAHPNDPELDEKGVLVVELFDTPTPAKGEKGLDTVTLPLNPLNGKEVSLDALPTIRLAARLAGTNAYVRAIFVDGKNSVKGDVLDYGSWVGGIDLLSAGITEHNAIEPIAVTAGAGTEADVPLIAFRKLTVTMHRTQAPVAGGDSQGPVGIIVVNGSNPAAKPATFGFGALKCADLATKDATVTGAVLGAGPYWVLGSLNDLLLPDKFPPGELASLNVVGSTATIPTKLDFAPTAYAITATVDLNFVVPLPLDAGAVGPNSCADLRAESDGGVDGG